MAAIDGTQKARIYHTLSQLNASFMTIVDLCQALAKEGAVRPKNGQRYQAFAQELLARINESTLRAMSDVELDDLSRYEKVRMEWEQSLRDPDDVFLLAARRKKQLAKQGKKLRKTE